MNHTDSTKVAYVDDYRDDHQSEVGAILLRQLRCVGGTARESISKLRGSDGQRKRNSDYSMPVVIVTSPLIARVNKTRCSSPLKG